MVVAVMGVLVVAAWAALRRRDCSVTRHPSMAAKTHGVRTPGARAERDDADSERARSQLDLHRLLGRRS